MKHSFILACILLLMLNSAASAYDLIFYVSKVKVEANYPRDKLSSIDATRRASEIAQKVWTDFCTPVAQCNNGDQFELSMSFWGSPASHDAYCSVLLKQTKALPYVNEFYYGCSTDSQVFREDREIGPVH